MESGAPNRSTIVVVRVDRAHGRVSRCDCCGARFRERSARLILADPPHAAGVICPECVLSGPAGAARRMRALLDAALDGAVDLGTSRGGPDLAAWARWMRRKIGMLEHAAPFPLAARLAAVRELRESR